MEGESGKRAQKKTIRRLFLKYREDKMLIYKRSTGKKACKVKLPNERTDLKANNGEDR